MGQKVSPIGLRVGINKPHTSNWIAKKEDIAKFIKEDSQLRKFIKEKYYACAISNIIIERTASKLTVNIFTGRPGVLIGTKGAGVETLKKEIAKISSISNINVNIREVKKIDIDATLIAESVAQQIEKRVAWRRAMKQAIQKAMRGGVKGVKIQIGGRLDGADIARSEQYKEGSLPLHTLRADIDYGTALSKTTFGIIGVKVWINRGEIYGKTIPADTNEGGNN